MTIIKKIYWFSARTVFYFFILLSLLTGGMIAVLLGPVYSWYFLNDIHCLKYRRFLFPSIKQSYRLVFDMILDSEYKTAFLTSMTASPKTAPDLSLVRVKDIWSGEKNSCNGCVKCCEKRECPLIDTVNKSCLGYGSFFWRYFNCGRYPENAEQIRYYDCPKWEILPDFPEQ